MQLAVPRRRGWACIAIAATSTPAVPTPPWLPGTAASGPGPGRYGYARVWTDLGEQGCLLDLGSISSSIELGFYRSEVGRVAPPELMRLAARSAPGVGWSHATLDYQGTPARRSSSSNGFVDRMIHRPSRTARDVKLLTCRND